MSKVLQIKWRCFGLLLGALALLTVKVLPRYVNLFTPQSIYTSISLDGDLLRAKLRRRPFRNRLSSAENRLGSPAETSRSHPDSTEHDLIPYNSEQEVTDVRIQSATLDYANPNYLNKDLVSVRVSRKSRGGVPAFNAFLPFIQDLPLETNITYHVFNKVRNAWRSTIVRGTSSLCTALEGKNKLMRFIFDYSNLPRKCPVRKGNYSFNDMTLKGDMLPPVVVASEMRTKVTWGMPQTLIYAYFMDIKIDKKGKADNPLGEASALLALNKTMATDA